jgi:integrase
MDGKVPTLVEEEPSTTDMPSVGKLCRRYLDEYASQVKRSWKDDEWLLSRYILPDFADMPADAFTTDVARKLFQSLDGVPRNRDKLRACLSTMFNVAVGKTKKLTIAEPWLPTSFVNPITNAATATHNADVNFPPLEEGRSYYRALVSNSAALKEDYRDVLLLQLLCASRIREVAEMAWSEVDLAAGRWTLPAARSKNGREHVVLLSAPALELLERRREWTAGPFVFPSSRNPRTQPLRSDLVSNVLAEHRQALGVGLRFTSHNVRHLFSTWAGEKRKPVEVVNRCTAHVVASGINRHYNAAKLDVPAKQLWADWARWLQR